MDSDPDASVALLAIKPRFAEAIIAGRKKVEFRKTRFSQPPQYIVMYASAPVKQVVAYFKVTYLKELTPKGLWKKFREVGCIEYEEFTDYYRTKERGLAIGVGEVWLLDRPAELHQLSPRLAVPQSFQYLCNESVNRLVCRKKRS